MNRRLFLCTLFFCSAACRTTVHTLCEHIREPLGLETRRPRFTWALTPATADAMPRGVEQLSYRIQVALSSNALIDSRAGAQNSMLWDSGVVSSNASSLVSYGADADLAADTVAFWRVGLRFTAVDSNDNDISDIKRAKFNGNETVWSSISRFSIGPDGAKLTARAQFIGLPGAARTDCPWLRRTFVLPAPAPGTESNGASVLALATVGSIGFHELFVNGRRASPDVLSPAVSNLAKRVLLRTYDISSLLLPYPHNNTVGLWLARGWADFTSVNPAVPNLFNSSNGSALAIAQLRVTQRADDTLNAAAAADPFVLVTDDAWKASPSDTMHLGTWQNSNFGGDMVNITRSRPGWASADFDDSMWPAATAVSAAASAHLHGLTLSNDVSEPNRRRDRIDAVSVIPVTTGSTSASVSGPAPVSAMYEVTMRRIFTGWVELRRLRAVAPGATITIKASSVPLCGSAAAQEDARQGRPWCTQNFPEFGMEHQVVAGADGMVDFFLPRFSYHEVRFLRICGIHPDAPAPPLSAIVGWRIGNVATMLPTGAQPALPGDGGGRSTLATFTASDPLLQRIYDTSMWTLANLVTGGMSVDCPHRERLGYIGDAHTTLETALQNLDSSAFYDKWLRDIMDIQGWPAHTADVDPSGYIGHTAPTIDGGGGPGWSGFVIVMPWELYRTTGDLRLLATARPAMESLLRFWERSQCASDGLTHDWGESANGTVIDPWTFLGDWLTPHGSERSNVMPDDTLLFNNCYILYCRRIVADVARALGDPSAAAAHDAAAAAIAEAIHTRFFVPGNSTADAAYLNTRQTNLVMPLVAGAVPPEYEAAVWASLLHEIADRQQNHLDTGLHGTYFLTKLLYDTSTARCGGHDSVAHALATVRTAPGYANLLDVGFQTWPEAWGTCHSASGDAGAPQPFACAAAGATNWSSGSQSPAHGTLNGMGQWFVSGAGGIRRAPSGAGYQRFELRPAVGVGGLAAVSASFVSPFGLIRCAWALRGGPGGVVELNATVPPNTAALVFVPASAAADVQESGQSASNSTCVRFVRMDLDREQPVAVFRVKSGKYSFVSKHAAKP